ncbi:MAG: adenylate/guanylate cyclase domain-containing protein [Pseudomonadota bacterium]
METWTTWSEITTDRTAEKYVEIVLSPDHINAANRAVETLLLLATAAVLAAAVQRARSMLRNQIAAERARSRVTEIFGQFVPSEVAGQLSTEDGQLPAEAREATVLFVDIEGFTTFAESAEPVRIVAALDAFFDRVSEIVSARRGVPISLIGDAVMASFNAPLANPDHAAAALAAGRDLLREVDGAAFLGTTFRIRVGIASGPVAAGTVGGRGRRAYTLYGDTVNLAQRLEALNKETGTRLLIDRATWVSAGAPPDFAPIDAQSVRGRSGEVEILAPASSAPVP